MIRPEDVRINMDEMKTMEMPRRTMTKLAVTVNGSGEFTLSPALMQKIKEMSPSLEVDLRRSEDARILLFRKPEEAEAFRIYKSGRFKYMEFMEVLKEKGYRIPARYAVAWNPGAAA